VHFAGHDWKTGEAFLYRHLLDGEPGPNALSWQWVASTFAAKPYVFNADNMRRNGVTNIGDAPFDASYDAIDRTVFHGYAQGGYAKRPKEQPQTKPVPHDPALVRPPGRKPLVVLHPERLSAHAEVIKSCPDAPVVIYLDGRRWQAEQPSERRRAFAERLAQDARDNLEVQGRHARVITLEAPSDLADHARTLGCESIAAPDSWHPGTWKTLRTLNDALSVSVVEDKPFAQASEGTSLRSFTAFWKHARKSVERRGPQQPLFND
jgi:deoxyribodipyrimidine photo-lyase